MIWCIRVVKRVKGVQQPCKSFRSPNWWVHRESTFRCSQSLRILQAFTPFRQHPANLYFHDNRRTKYSVKEMAYFKTLHGQSRLGTQGLKHSREWVAPANQIWNSNLARIKGSSEGTCTTGEHTRAWVSRSHPTWALDTELELPCDISLLLNLEVLSFTLSLLSQSTWTAISQQRALLKDQV